MLENTLFLLVCDVCEGQNVEKKKPMFFHHIFVFVNARNAPGIAFSNAKSFLGSKKPMKHVVFE